MPKGKKISALRADSAAYQAAIFNYCEETGKVLAIGVDQDAAVKAAIANIPGGEWKAFRDGEIAETVHCMNKTNKAFRLIVMRRPREQDLFEDKSPYRYHAIASNRANEDAAATMEWYSRRGDASENRIKDLKIGFGMEYMPCGSFQANAVFFAIGALTYNLYLGFRSHALGSEWERSQVQTVRWRLFQTAGKIVRHVAGRYPSRILGPRVSCALALAPLVRVSWRSPSPAIRQRASEPGPRARGCSGPTRAAAVKEPRQLHPGRRVGVAESGRVVDYFWHSTRSICTWNTWCRSGIMAACRHASRRHPEREDLRHHPGWPHGLV
jgi:hypothetical protein